MSEFENGTSEDIEKTAHILEEKLNKDRRPSITELKGQGVYQTEIEARGVELQHEQAGVTVKHMLDSRPTISELKDQGVYQTEIEARGVELQHEQAAVSVKHTLERRPSITELENRGIYHTQMEARGLDLQRELTEDKLEKDLERRHTVKELEQLGIYKTEIEGKSTELEHQMAASRLSHKLNKDRRPSIAELADKGIIKDPETSTVERDLAAGKLNHDLTYRRSKEELESGGIIKSQEQEKESEIARATAANEVAARLGPQRRPSVQMLVEQGILGPASE